MWFLIQINPVILSILNQGATGTWWRPCTADWWKPSTMAVIGMSWRREADSSCREAIQRVLLCAVHICSQHWFQKVWRIWRHWCWLLAAIHNDVYRVYIHINILILSYTIQWHLVTVFVSVAVGGPLPWQQCARSHRSWTAGHSFIAQMTPRWIWPGSDWKRGLNLDAEVVQSSARMLF